MLQHHSDDSSSGSQATHTWSGVKLLCSLCHCFRIGRAPAPLSAALKVYIHISTLTSIAADLSKCNQWDNSCMRRSQRQQTQAGEVQGGRLDMEEKPTPLSQCSVPYEEQIFYHVKATSLCLTRKQSDTILLRFHTLNITYTWECERCCKWLKWCVLQKN